MPDLFSPLEWNDGRGGGTPATVARGPRRWEAGIEALDVKQDEHDGRLDALESALSGLGSADVMTTAERLAVTPTEGKLILDSDLPALLIGKPGGVGWWKIDVTSLTGAGSGGGGATAPALTGALEPGGTIGQFRLTVPASSVPAGATAVTFRESRSPNGVSGMPVTPVAGVDTVSVRTPGTAGGYDYWVTYTLAGVESPASNHFISSLPYVAPGGGGGGGGGGATGTPAQILNIGPGATQNHMNVGVGYSTGHVDHTQAEIVNGYAENPYFQPNAAGDAVQFVVFANGKTTSNLTGHPRSEMRELFPDDAHKAAWLAASGTHIQSATTKIVRLPPDSESTGGARPWICFAQIHDTAISGTDPVAGTDYKGADLIRLQVEGNFANGFSIISRVHTPDAYNNRSETKTTLQSSYTVGNDIVWKIEVINGVAKIYLGGVVKQTFPLTPKNCYFKSGNYSQFSTKSGDGGYLSSSYAVVEMKNLVVTHS